MDSKDCEFIQLLLQFFVMFVPAFSFLIHSHSLAAFGFIAILAWAVAVLAAFALLAAVGAAFCVGAFAV